MSKGARGDVARQVAVVLGAIFQIAVPLFTGPAVGRVSGENPTLVVPADYAFVIWTPIFVLALIYAVYQALPSNRENPLLRRIGWFSALAYFSNGSGRSCSPRVSSCSPRWYSWGSLLAPSSLSSYYSVGLGRVVGSTTGSLRRPSGCSPAGSRPRSSSAFVTVLVATGVLSGGIGEALFGALMLIVGGAVACAVILAGRTGPVQGYFAYGGAVLWALAGVVANQYQNSLITSSTSIVCALLVAAILVIALRRSDAGRGASQPSRPRVA